MQSTLGVAVFGPDPAYDTNPDPVVRVTEAPLEAAVTMTDLHKAERVGFADAEAPANLTAYLATKKKAYRLRLQEDGQLD